MDIFDEINLTRTIKDFEFTRRAIRGIHMTVDSKDFENMDAEKIINYLLNEMQAVSFKDYLKRYIVEQAQIDRPLQDISDKDFQRILQDSFAGNLAPLSFTPTTKKKSAIIKGWLTQDSVKRNTVFILGFGLAMPAEDVEKFLERVLQEQGFDFTNYEEAIYWHCYKNHLPYSSALKFKKYYEETERAGITQISDCKILVGLPKNEMFDLAVEEDLLEYLTYLKNARLKESANDAAWRSFNRLLQRTKELIASMYTEDEKWEGSSKTWTAEEIKTADVEKVICSGIPVNKSGNLMKGGSDGIFRYIADKKLSRQRIDALQKGVKPVKRFDLITLEFFIVSKEKEDEIADERCRIFIDEINSVLRECSMGALHPTNPYEAFVMLCTLTEMPMAAYSEVWARSYGEEMV